MLFSEPKIPQSDAVPVCVVDVLQRFSALQRAENSSIQNQTAVQWAILEFQCSSASRKFLNTKTRRSRDTSSRRFSALQRAENSSIGDNPGFAVEVKAVSVLFSEPKIPQYLASAHTQRASACFSALQRAENSSIRPQTLFARPPAEFQCSSASRKFLNQIRPSRALRR